MIGVEREAISNGQPLQQVSFICNWAIAVLPVAAALIRAI
jgi:hypothetical protein